MIIHNWPLLIIDDDLWLLSEYVFVKCFSDIHDNPLINITNQLLFWWSVIHHFHWWWVIYHGNAMVSQSAKSYRHLPLWLVMARAAHGFSHGACSTRAARCPQERCWRSQGCVARCTSNCWSLELIIWNHWGSRLWRTKWVGEWFFTMVVNCGAVGCTFGAPWLVHLWFVRFIIDQLGEA